MHHLLRNLIVLGFVVSLLLIYAVQAASILSVVNYEADYNAKNCSPPGAVCDGNPPCCHDKCRVNWGGSWCT
jgi:hypothetical protein